MKRYKLIHGAAEDWALAILNLSSDDARIAAIDSILDKGRALRRKIIESKATKAAVTVSSRTWTTPEKDDFTDDVDGRTMLEGAGSNNGQTAVVGTAAVDFYNEVTQYG